MTRQIVPGRLVALRRSILWLLGLSVEWAIQRIKSILTLMMLLRFEIKRLKCDVVENRAKIRTFDPL